MATTTLLGLGIIQINWILQAHRLQQEQVRQQLKAITPKIAVALEIADFFKDHEIIEEKEPFAFEQTSNFIDSMLVDAGFSLPIPHAIFQQKSDGVFYSNAPNLKAELQLSDYKTCLSCIITIQYVKDTLNPVTPEMTFIRSVSEMEKLGKNREDFLWVSVVIPDENWMSKRAILGLFLLTVLLMSILVGLFYYILKSLAQQKKLRQVKDDFFNNMTHEFKTPLASILLASKSGRTIM